MSDGATFGAGPVSVLAFQCQLARGRAWAGVAAALGPGVTLTAPDQPGHGGAAPWDGQNDYGAVALARAEAALAACETPVHLVGHSFGAVLALASVGRGAAVASLTLVEPVWFGLAEGLPGRAANDALFAEIAQQTGRGDMAAATRRFTGSWDDGTPWDALTDRQRAYLTERMPLVLASDRLLLSDLDGLGAPGGLERLAVPTLLIEGARSPAVIDEIQSTLVRRLPGASRLIVPDAGHMVPLTHPEPVAAAIAAHIARQAR